MKSEHRHELQTNELAKWLSQVPEMLNRNKKMVIYIIVVAILVVVSSYVTLYRNKSQQQQYESLVTFGIGQEAGTKYQIAQAMFQGGDNSMELSNQASRLVGNAEQLKNDRLKALAYIKAADMLRAELQFKPQKPEKPVIETQIQNAQNYYNQALAIAGGDEVIVSMAKYGLGLCQEELGNFEEAVKIYSEISKNPDFQVSPARFQAEQRLAGIEDYKNEVEFLPAPVVEKLDQTEQMAPEVGSESIFDQLNMSPEDSNSN